jgi:hypothetical protein
MARPTNIKEAMNATLTKAFIKNEENFLNNSRYTGTEYSRVQANLEDNAEIETVLLNLNSFTYTPVIIDFTDPTNLIDAVGTKIDTFTYTEVPITKEYEAIRQSVTSQLNNPIKIINNKIEINKTYNLPIFITVKYQQEFKIKAGSLFSNTFELLNKNTKFDTNLYMDLTTETVANIGSQSSFNALKMVNYKANYTGTAIQELDKWIIGIAQSREYDIVGTITIYSDIIISPYTTVIELPLMRSGYLINEDDQNNITGFGKSISNDLPAIDIIKVHNGDNNQVLLKSEPIVSNGKFYNRIMAFMNNLNTSSEDLEFKIEMVKNIIIPRGEVKGSYSLALRNLIPSLSPLSPITAVGNYDPYVNGYLITVDEFLNEDPIIDTEVIPETAPEYNNVITTSEELDKLINFHNFTSTVLLEDNKVTYMVSIVENNATVEILEDGILIGEAKVDSNGNFSTQLLNPLAEGEHTIYFKIRDEYNNISEASPTITFKVDTIAPVPPRLSSYFIDDTSINMATFENLQFINKYYMSGITNNPSPTVIGYLYEDDIKSVNIYVNDILTGININIFKNSQYRDERYYESAAVYGFIYNIPSLRLGVNTITYEIIDTAGNISRRSQAAFIKYQLSPETGTPEVYIIDDVGTKFEFTNAVDIQTDDNTLQFLGTGAKNNTYTKIYLVTPDGLGGETETEIGRALVKNNNWSFKYTFNYINRVIRFKIKKLDGTTVIKDRMITFKTDAPTVTISLDDIVGETYYKKVIFTFSESVTDFTVNDIFTEKCSIVKTSLFGIAPLQTTDNIVFEAVLKLTDYFKDIYQFEENYGEGISDLKTYIRLASDSVYNNIGIGNEAFTFTDNSFINEGTVIVAPVTLDTPDTINPFTPVIQLTITDTRYGTKVVNNGEIINDNQPTFSGKNIGSWFQDIVIPIKFTKNFKIYKNTNYNSEIAYASLYDKFRAGIVQFEATDQSESYYYLKKNSPWHDYLFYKSGPNIILPSFDEFGVLYYKTLTITYNDINKTYSLKVSKYSALEYMDNPIIENQNLKDYLANYSKDDAAGELNLNTYSYELPVVEYQKISNNSTLTDRTSTALLERYLVLFTDTKQTSFPKFYYENGIKIYYEAPQFFNFLILNESGLVSDGLQYNVLKFTQTDDYYIFTWYDSFNTNISTFEPVVIKLQFFYDFTIPMLTKESNIIKLPIMPYQTIDNSALEIITLDNFTKIYTTLTISDDLSAYEYTLKRVIPKEFNNYDIERKQEQFKYSIVFSTYKNIKFLPYDITDTNIVNPNRFHYPIEIMDNNGEIDILALTLIDYKILDNSGTQYSAIFNIEYNLEDFMLVISPKELDNSIVNDILYSQLTNTEFNIKLTFGYSLNNYDATEYFVKFTTPNLNYFYNNITDLEYYRLDRAENEDIVNGLIEPLTYLIKHEYYPEQYLKNIDAYEYDSIRVNGYDLTENKHLTTSNIETYRTYDEIMTNFTESFSVTKIYVSNPIKKLFFNSNSPYNYLIGQTTDILTLSESPKPNITFNKPQEVVYDLAYYGLSKVCEVRYINGQYKIKALGNVYLNNKNFLDNQLINLAFLSGFEPTEINYADQNLENRPPRYIWIHTEPDSDIPSEVNNLTQSEYNGSIPNFNYKKLSGKYVEWIWDNEADGDFWINNNQLDHLTTIFNNPLPSIIKGSFYCNNNNLTSLTGGPHTVYGTYNAKNNKLNSLNGIASIIGGASKIYFYPGMEPWQNLTDTSWTKMNTLFNDDDLIEANNSILESEKLGSSLDLSFNPELSIDAFAALPTNFGKLGWNLYLAGTNIIYNDTNIGTIRTKYDMVGLIYFHFDITKFTYVINDPSLNLSPSNLNKTDFNDSDFYDNSNRFTRLLDVTDNYNNDIRSTVGTSSIYSTLYNKIKWTGTPLNSTFKLNIRTPQEIL